MKTTGESLCCPTLDPMPSRRAEKRERWEARPQNNPPPGTGTPMAVRFRESVASFQRATGARRRDERARLIQSINAAQRPDDLISTLLSTLTDSRIPGRLDDGIDILSKVGSRLSHFVLEASGRDAGNYDEDSWYILIRALGRSQIQGARLLIEMLRGRCLEAAIEAFSELGDPESRSRLQSIANDATQGNAARELAAQALDDCAP